MPTLELLEEEFHVSCVHGYYWLGEETEKIPGKEDGFLKVKIFNKYFFKLLVVLYELKLLTKI